MLGPVYGPIYRNISGQCVEFFYRFTPPRGVNRILSDSASGEQVATIRLLIACDQLPRLPRNARGLGCPRPKISHDCQPIFGSESTGYLLNQEFLVCWQREEQAAVPDDSRTNKVIILEAPD